ncbi:MFS transporter [Parerythrobacter aurantius]|uniref:MFS transporter n=1 Tax=Parerythrobacter aurantius TaxID=3127706 RepID=UPI003248650B
MAEADPSPHTTPATHGAAQPAITRGRLVLLFMVMLVTAAGNTAMQSVMPSIGTELGVADVWISLAYTWSALLWVVCAPMWAKRSDKRGRKAMMALGMIGFISSMALCGLALQLGLGGVLGALWTLVLFALCRSLYGLFGSAAPPAVQAYVASRTPRSERTQALALVASSFGLGTVLGPALAPLLLFPGTGLTGPFYAFAAFAVLVLIALRLGLPDDEPQFAARGKTYDAPFGSGAGRHVRDDDGAETESEESGETQAAPAIDPPDLRWTDKRLLPWMIAGLLGGHAQAMILGISGFLVLDRLGLRATPEQGAGPVGLVLMVGAVATLLAQWGLIPTLRLGPRASTLWGMLLAIVGVAIVAVAWDLHAIALGFAVASLGFGLYRPGFTAGASLAVTRPEQGQVSGKVASINGASYIYAPALGVWLYGHSDWLGFAVIIAFCLAVFVIGSRSLQSDEDLTRDRA